MKIKGTPQFFLELRCTKPSLLVFCLPRVGDKLFNIRLLSVLPCFRKPIPALTPAYAFSSCGVSFPVLELFLLKTAIRSALPVLISSFANRVLLVSSSVRRLIVAEFGLHTGLRFFRLSNQRFVHSFRLRFIRNGGIIVFVPCSSCSRKPIPALTPAYAFSSCEIKDFYVAIIVLPCLSWLSPSQHRQHRLTLFMSSRNIRSSGK